MEGGWSTIESDPGVFTELIREIGVEGVQVEELFALDEGSLRQLEPVYGLVFLFKWVGGQKPQSEPSFFNAPSVFFANQVINNACATQAILSILLNADGVQLGEELSSFKSFTADFTSDLKGLAISNSERIRTVHNSFGRPSTFVQEERPASKDDDDVFHFISYIHADGHLLELDGLQQGPIDHGACSQDEWLTKVVPVVQKRIDRYSAAEIHFNLMAVVKDRATLYHEQIARLQAAAGGGKEGAEGEIFQLRERIAEEESKMARYRVENARRKHDFVPFIMASLRQLADNGKLPDLVKVAREKARQRYQKALLAQQQK